MDFLLHCVVAGQGHSYRAALNFSNSVMSRVLTKFAVCFGYYTKNLSFCNHCWTCVPYISQWAQHFKLCPPSLGPSCSSCAPETSIFLHPTMLRCFPEGRVSLFFKVPLTQSKVSKEASAVLHSERNLACISVWLLWRTAEVLTVSSHRRGRR